MSAASNVSGRPVWARVNLTAVAHNVRVIRGLLKPQTKFCAVVKADAYGHGALPVARVALENGAGYLAVAILDEALALRRAGITAPILILGYTPPEQAPLLVEHGITQTVFSLDDARAISAAAVAAGKKARVHLKIDTGMGRIGVPPAEAPDFAAAVAVLPGLHVEGAFTHMASADERDKSYTRWQFARFMEAMAGIEARGVTIPIKHVANSATTLELPEMHLDMVRPGIILYGLWPSPEVRRVVDLKPAMELKARVAQVKEVPAGTSISYGRKFTTAAPSVIATLPIGYADGWSRLLSNKASVLIHGRRAPVVGRVCMDQCMVDVTGIPGVRAGDEAVLFGTQKGRFLPVEEVAAHMGTINYEVVCLISKRVPRVYFE
ncbi:alanine racemase [Desulfofundulus thermobenzoicus]|uniref:Alanine racemase n=1 Tax=Desulfofundulus thermobenzoicus TaxID=29376 RepID=A0A6N7IMI8_9FIRM|nr:alanine racemase [Desulfofundulus thermobenzoicus]MQL51190.1 alanine racemase [Desulfofundulus thermobenzoicus]HHW43639.1 alanine racemase [Desulfotomaculum sp.]